MTDESPPLKALRLVQGFVEKMGESKTLDDLEDNWCLFLFSLRRCWHKAEHFYKGRPDWGSLYGQSSGLIKQDALLKYIWHARNSDGHRFEDITQRVGGNMVISGQGKFYGLRIIGNEINLDATPGIKLTFNPHQIEAVAVEDRDVIYHPPGEHLGKPISKNVIDLARAGLHYYESIIFKIEGINVIPSSQTGKNQ